MALLKTAQMGHPVLREISTAVRPDELESTAFQLFIDDLISTMRESNGVGLAAPQVHVAKRVIAMEVANNPRYPDAGSFDLQVLVNPHLEFLSAASEVGWEGCLSIPDIWGRVSRYRTVRLTGQDRFGKDLALQLTGFPAVIAQHEIDHLNGVLFLDQVTDTQSLSFHKEYVQYHQ